MQSLAGAAIAVLVGASLLVGIRLLALHLRTRGWPELLLGSMLLLSVGVGYPLRIAAERGGLEYSGLLLAVSDASIAAGFAFLFLFTCTVFRPQEIWARVLVVVGTIWLLGHAAMVAFQVYGQNVPDVMAMTGTEILIQTGPMLLVYGWTAWESLRYHVLMRRRVKIGLAEAEVSNRFLLWGVMGVAAFSGISLNDIAVALRIDTFNSPGILLLSATSGMVQTVCLVLAFVPPRVYRDWVRGRAATVEA